MGEAPGERVVMACATGNVAKLQSLLAKEKLDANSKNEDGQNGMMLAARGGHISVIHVLCEHCPDINAQDPEGKTALDFAIEAKQDKVVKFMTADESLLPFMRGLLPAIARGDAETIAHLFDEATKVRANVNTIDNRKCPALHCAVKEGKVDIVKLILDQGNLNINSRDRYGSTALDMADEKDLKEIADMIRKKGGIKGNEVGDEPETDTGPWLSMLSSPSSDSPEDCKDNSPDKKSTSNHARALAIFKAWDVNGDGTISEDELKTALVGIGMSEKVIAVAFREADANNDGVVNYEEFLAWVYSLPTSAKMKLYKN